MKKNCEKPGFFRTICLIAAGALALTMFMAYSGGVPVNDASARLLAQTDEPYSDAFSAEAPVLTEETTPSGEPSGPSEPAGPTETGPCGTIRSNEQINTTPLVTVSDNCVTATVTEGTVAFDYIPDSFSFPIKHSSAYGQDSFSNDNPATMNTDVSTGTEDILTLHDYRNNGGFAVTITASPFESTGGTIPLSNLFLVATYPDANDFDVLDPTLSGPETEGVEYATGSKGAKDIINSAFATGDLSLAETYPVSFDANRDETPDIVELMSTDTGHVGRFSQALGFLLKIPENQSPGTYQVRFTIDLIY